MTLIERLRQVVGETTRYYVNPDGPEAADEIERLRDQVFQFKNATPQILSSHNNIVKNYVTNTELILSEVREDNKRLREEIKGITGHGVEQMNEIERLREALNGAYQERNNLVALLASLFPSGIKKTAIEGWDEEWHGCVYIDFPWSQASWHYHSSEADLFSHLPEYHGDWDGHTTEQKYAAIRAALKGDE